MQEFLNTDCLPELKKYPDKFFELAIVDPPYFEGPNKRKYYGRSESKTNIARVEYPVIDTWDIPGREYFCELKRVSQNQIIWGCNYFDYKFGPGRIIWDKCNGASSFSDCEIAYCSIHDSVRLFRYMWNGMMQGKSIEEGHIQQGNKRLNEKRIHPCQKPINLYLWLLSKYASPGDKILDTHTGSASSLIACHRMGFDYVAFEKSKEVYDLANKRIREETAQVRLFSS